jgi:uncharacterized protein YneF (UPF0154 family)
MLLYFYAIIFVSYHILIIIYISSRILMKEMNNHWTIQENQTNESLMHVELKLNKFQRKVFR